MDDDRDQTDAELLACDISDEALEAAASEPRDTIMTLPGGLSVNVMCCNGD